METHSFTPGDRVQLFLNEDQFQSGTVLKLAWGSTYKVSVDGEPGFTYTCFVTELTEL